MADIRKLNTADVDFQEELDALLAWDSVSDTAVNDVVHDVIAQIRARGDAALMDYTNRFDGWEAGSAADLEIPLERHPSHPRVHRRNPASRSPWIPARRYRPESSGTLTRFTIQWDGGCRRKDLMQSHNHRRVIACWNVIDEITPAFVFACFKDIATIGHLACEDSVKHQLV